MKGVWNIVPMVLMNVLVWRVKHKFTFYYTCVRPQCDSPFLGGDIPAHLHAHPSHIPSHSHSIPCPTPFSPVHRWMFQQEPFSRKRRWLSTRKPQRHAHERWATSHPRVAESNYTLRRHTCHVSFVEGTHTDRAFFQKQPDIYKWVDCLYQGARR